MQINKTETHWPRRVIYSEINSAPYAEVKFVKIRLATIPFLLLFLGASFADAGSIMITESEFGERWPFTISRGTLSCTPSGKFGIVTFTANGKTYAVNGIAKGHAKQNGWREIDEIWKVNPSFPGTKINMHPIIEKGLSLCK